MITYRLRFFFDYGSGVCFWGANEPAQQQFGYPIETEQLPLATTTKAFIEHLISSYDQSLNWADPGGPGLWTTADWEDFHSEVQTMLTCVREELGDTFEIFDEYRRR